jgi:YbbR domain-containing protein
VRVRPDLEGEPAQGFLVAGVEVEPDRVWLVGARSEVLRLSEVVTETVDVSGLSESEEREVRLSLGGGHVWMEDNSPVTLRIAIEPVPETEGAAGSQAGAGAG